MIVWITGASSGIGEACACRYAQQGAALVLTSTSARKLEKVAERCLELGAADVMVLPFDLSRTDGIEDLVSSVYERFGRLDVLYCNAGVSQRTSVMDTSMEMVRRLMEINYFAPVAMTKAVLPRMIADGGGHIAVTSSIAGKFGFPLRCAYSSSKHAVYGFFETLAAEYHDRGIRVTVVCPGRVRTDISVNSLDKGGVRHGVMDPGQESGLSPEKAAEKIVRAISKGGQEVLVGRGELIMVHIKRFFPRLCSRLARRIKPM